MPATRRTMQFDQRIRRAIITPQGGSQNVIFVASGYLTQREFYRLGLAVTLFFLAIFMVVGTPWILVVN